MPRPRAGAARALALGGCPGARARGGKGGGARQCGRSPSPLSGGRDGAGAALEAAGAALVEWRHLDVSVTVAPEEAVALWLYEEPPICELGDGGAAAAGGARPIADLALRGLHVSYVSFATQATRLEVSVKDVLCDDIRPGSTNQFKRLVAPIAAGGEGEGARAGGEVLSYLAETPEAGPSQTVLRFGHVEVILIPEVIFPVLDVFTLPPADPRAAPAAAPARPAGAALCVAAASAASAASRRCWVGAERVCAPPARDACRSRGRRGLAPRGSGGVGHVQAGGVAARRHPRAGARTGFERHRPRRARGPRRAPRAAPSPSSSRAASPWRRATSPCPARGASGRCSARSTCGLRTKTFVCSLQCTSPSPPRARRRRRRVGASAGRPSGRAPTRAAAARRGGAAARSAARSGSCGWTLGSCG